MLEYLRHHQKSVLLVVTVVVCITFGWFYVRQDTGAGQAGGSTVLGSIYGKEITAREAQAMERHATVAAQLQLPGVDLLNSLIPPGSEIGYIAAMRIIREESANLGLATTPEEVEKFITTLPAFQSNGKFDPMKFNLYAGEGANDGLFIERMTPWGQPQTVGPFKLSRLGMSVGDLRDVVGDFMLLDKLRGLLGAGLAYSEKEAERDHAVMQQTLKSTIIRIPDSRFLDAVQATDEEIARDYEGGKAAGKSEFMTPKKWAIEYVAITAEKPPEAAPPPPAADGSAPPPPPAPEPESAEKKRARAMLADKIYREFGDNKNFAEVASSHGQTPVTTGLFDLANLPEAFNGRNMLVSAISKLRNEQVGNVPVPVEDGDTWYVFRLVQVEEPRVKPLEELKEEIVKGIKDRKAREAALKAAEEVAGKLKPLIEAGKSFADAAAEIGEKTEEPGAAEQSMDASEDQRAIEEELGLAKPGTLGKPVAVAKGVIVPFLVAREITKSETKGAQITSQASRMSQGLRFAVFSEWWFNRLGAAEFIDKTRGAAGPQS